MGACQRMEAGARLMMTAERLADAPVKAPTTDQAPACWRCGRTLADFLSRPWSLRCKRCKAQNCSPDCTTSRDIVD